MRRVLFVFCALLVCLVSSAKGDIKHISATYEYISDNPNETPEQAEQSAFQNARKKAMEEHFGLDVIGITNHIQRNRIEGEKATTSSSFTGITETVVRGEWIEDIKKRVVEKVYERGFWRVKVYVEGRARNHSADKAAIQYAFVNDIDDTEPREYFKNGNDIFLRFLSPVSGALCVYLVDEEQTAYCLLPYQNSDCGYQAVEANREYIFFTTITDSNADEYTLNCQQSSEQNVMYVIFSPNIFTKAGDKQSGKNWQDEQLPRQLDYESFMKWLARNQARDENMLVRHEIVTIKK